MAAVATLLLLLAPAASQMSFEPPRPGRDKLPGQIEAWRPGMPVPPEALRLQASSSDLLLPTDSEAIVRDAKNYPFMVALATHPKADPEVVRMAVRRALLLRGPSTAFGDLRKRYKESPQLTRAEVHQELQLRMQQRHVWVTGIDVEPAAFGHDRSREVLEEIATRLRGGEAWQAVYDEYSRRFRRKDGRTYLGNFGSYVTPEVRDEKNGGLDLLVPAYHMGTLLKARDGDLLILAVQPGAYGFEFGHGPFLVLWQVHEVYSPDSEGSAGGRPSLSDQPHNKALHLTRDLASIM